MRAGRPRSQDNVFRVRGRTNLRGVRPGIRSIGLPMKTSLITRRRFLRTSIVAAASAPFITRGATNDGFEIGLVADAQYADVEAKGTRFYRDSIGKLGAAVEHFNGRDLAFCVHLGDL